MLRAVNDSQPVVEVPLPVLLLELRAVDELQLVVEAPLPVLLLALATVGELPSSTCGLNDVNSSSQLE